MNKLGKKRIPFLFIIDFDMKKPIIQPLSDILPDQILYSINGFTNTKNEYKEETDNIDFNATSVSKKRYEKAFRLVQSHIRYGDSFLLNLTMPSKIEVNLSLLDIFKQTKAKYKLWVKDSFVVFSPEIFIQTKGRRISSFPMKGTIDATLPNAKQKLLKSEKELAEHYTIVDLIRNDLSMVAKNVKVEKFRYIDHIATNLGGLLQMSSEVIGELPENFLDHLGDIVVRMLPAGSISGAPKKRTIEIIKNTENYDRGYYTGICGLFDGSKIDSGVMIRYIEQTSQGLFYKSGGGITFQSNIDEEFQEMKDKVYIPIAK